MTFLDTHIILWLFDKLSKKLTQKARKTIEKGELFVSPMVVLELAYLYEVNRIQDPASAILKELEDTIGISVSVPNFNLLINKAVQIEWTRDPFDRIITAEAAMNDAYLVSADQTIRKYYSKTVW